MTSLTVDTSALRASTQLRDTSADLSTRAPAGQTATSPSEAASINSLRGSSPAEGAGDPSLDNPVLVNRVSDGVRLTALVVQMQLEAQLANSTHPANGTVNTRG